MLRWHILQKLLEQDHTASFGSYLSLCYLPNGVAAKGICNAVMLSVNIWLAWQEKYLKSLQARNKWRRTHRNFEVGDTILIKDRANLAHGYSDKSLSTQGWVSQSGQYPNSRKDIQACHRSPRPAPARWS